MDELAKMILSPAWWVGVVIVGLLMNLSAAYLKPRLDNRLSRVSSWWATRTREQRAARARRVAGLKGSVAALAFANIQELRHRVSSIMYGVFAIFGTVVTLSPSVADHRAVWIPAACLTVLAMLFGMNESMAGSRIQSEIHEASKEGQPIKRKRR